MYRSVILFVTFSLSSMAAFAQNQALSLNEIKREIQVLHGNLRTETNNEKRVAMIAKLKTAIDARIDQVALDESIPFDSKKGESVSQYYRQGDQIMILGMLKADGSTRMNADSCMNARSQVSLLGIDVVEDTNVVPAHLVEVAKTIELICK